MSAACSAVLARAWGVSVIAHNIANLNTAGFDSRRALYACGPRGFGADLYSVDMDPPHFPVEDRAASGINGTASDSLADTVSALDEAPANVGLAREMARLISAEAGFSSNANVISIQESVYDCLLSLKV